MNKSTVSTITYITPETLMYFPECLKSIACQTQTPNEILIVGQYIPELDRALKNMTQLPIKYYYDNSINNIVEAYNLAVEKSTSDYLMICDVKSRLNPQVCEVFASELDQHNEISLVYANTLIIDNPQANFSHVKENTIAINRSFYKFEILIDDELVGLSPMWRRSIHQKLGLFQNNYQFHSIYEFWIKIGEISQLKLISLYSEVYSSNKIINKTFDLNKAFDKHQLCLKYQNKYFDQYFNFKNNLFYRQHLLNPNMQLQESTLNCWFDQLSKLSQLPVFDIILYATSEYDLELLYYSLANLKHQLYSKFNIHCFSTEKLDINKLKSLGFQFNYIQTNSKNITSFINQHFKKSLVNWVGLFPVGTLFNPETLLKLAYQTQLIDNNQYKIYYTDEDQIDFKNNENRLNPLLKPDFNLDFFTSSFFTGQACFYHQDVFKTVVLQELNLSQYEFILHSLLTFGEKSIGHIPMILTHFEVSKMIDLKLYHNILKNYLKVFFTTAKINVNIDDGLIPATFEIKYIHQSQPLVSIVIPNKNRLDLIQPCLETLFDKTDYPNFEVVIVDNQSNEQQVIDYYEQLANKYPEKIRFVLYDAPFNFSAQCNLGVEYSKGDYILLLNNDTEILHEDWLTKMMNHAQRQDVGIVGAMLLFPNETVQHAGVVMGFQNVPNGIFSVANHLFMDQNANSYSYMNRHYITQEFSAVTGACLLINKNLYQQVHGMNEKKLPILFNDIDLCLKIKQLNKKIIYVPHTKLVHKQGITSLKVDKALNQKSDSNKKAQFIEANLYMCENWLNYIINDPFYNPQLNLIYNLGFIDYNFIGLWEKNKPQSIQNIIIFYTQANQNKVDFFIQKQFDTTQIQILKFNLDSSNINLPYLSEMGRLSPNQILIDHEILAKSNEIQKHRIELYKFLNIPIHII